MLCAHSGLLFFIRAEPGSVQTWRRIPCTSIDVSLLQNPILFLSSVPPVDECNSSCAASAMVRLSALRYFRCIAPALIVVDGCLLCLRKYKRGNIFLFLCNSACRHMPEQSLLKVWPSSFCTIVHNFAHKYVFMYKQEPKLRRVRPMPKRHLILLTTSVCGCSRPCIWPSIWRGQGRSRTSCKDAPY